MRKGKEEIEGPWVWTRARMRSDMEDYFIVEGVLLILTFFVLILTVGGPYLRTEVRYLDGRLEDSDVPIWIVFLYTGSITIMIGLLLKLPCLLMRPRMLLGITLLATTILTFLNMFAMAAYFLFWFLSVDIDVLYWLQPVLLFVTCYVSSFYLYVQGSSMPKLNILPPPNPIPETKKHILF